MSTKSHNILMNIVKYFSTQHITPAKQKKHMQEMIKPSKQMTQDKKTNKLLHINVNHAKKNGIYSA